MPTDEDADAVDDADDAWDEPSSGLMAGAKRLRDGPLWLGLAPLLILGAAVLATALGSVELTLAILFAGAAIWGVVVWRFARDR